MATRVVPFSLLPQSKERGDEMEEVTCPCHPRSNPKSFPQLSVCVKCSEQRWGGFSSPHKELGAVSAFLTIH